MVDPPWSPPARIIAAERHYRLLAQSLSSRVQGDGMTAAATAWASAIAASRVRARPASRAAASRSSQCRRQRREGTRPDGLVSGIGGGAQRRRRAPRRPRAGGPPPRAGRIPRPLRPARAVRRPPSAGCRSFRARSRLCSVVGGRLAEVPGAVADGSEGGLGFADPPVVASLLKDSSDCFIPAARRGRTAPERGPYCPG